MNTVVISDLHLGSEVCRSHSILSFLESFDCLNSRLVLNGDIFDNINFAKLKKSHWKILKRIKHISNETDVVWIYGNHDSDASVIAGLIGIPFVSEHTIETKEKKILISHGDKYDAFIENYPITTKIADFLYRCIQRFDRICGNGYLLSGSIKRSSKTFLGATEVLSRNAIRHCKDIGYDAIICGHTHKACQLTNLETGIQYTNGGCWTDSVCNYVVIDSYGIHLKEFNYDK